MSVCPYSCLSYLARTTHLFYVHMVFRAVTYFSTLFHKRHEFQEKIL
jgi:hypothetical protein